VPENLEKISEVRELSITTFLKGDSYPERPPTLNLTLGSLAHRLSHIIITQELEPVSMYQICLYHPLLRLSSDQQLSAVAQKGVLCLTLALQCVHHARSRKAQLVCSRTGVQAQVG
jgi:hypothetical protein